MRGAGVLRGGGDVAQSRLQGDEIVGLLLSS